MTLRDTWLWMDLFPSSDLSIWSTVAFSLWEILIILLPLFPLTFLQTQKWMPYSFAQLMTILMLIGVVFVIISEMFLGKISINLVLLLLLNFGIAFKLEIYIPHWNYQVKSHSSFSWFTAASAASSNKSFVFTNRRNLHIKKNSGRPVIIAKWLLKLPNLPMLMKQKSL